MYFISRKQDDDICEDSTDLVSGGLTASGTKPLVCIIQEWFSKHLNHGHTFMYLFAFLNSLTPAFALLSANTSWAQVKPNWGNINWLTTILISSSSPWFHDDVIKWKHFPRYWPFVWGIHRSPVNSPHKGQWRGALMFSLIYVWINGSINNGEAGDLRRHRAHYEVTVLLALPC